jgi:aminoglycoside 6'-N-acetyltransferase I
MSKSGGIDVRPARPADGPEWRRLRRLLWPDADDGEVDSFFRDGGFPHFSRFAVFVADRGDGRLAGFVEASARAYAEGCNSTPVAFIEGWFVDEDRRRSGVGAALFAAAEDWARGQGFCEIGSDALIGNDVSIAAHKALGYGEVERIVCFAKKL